MRFIKRVTREFFHFGKDAGCHVLGNSVFNRALDVHFFITIQENGLLLFHFGNFLFAHRTAHNVGLSQRIATQNLKDLHYLFLINNLPIGFF